MSQNRLQSIFNQVIEGLASQNWRQSKNSRCAYRGSNGLKCAAGWLIPDSEYRESMEDLSVTRIDYFCNNFNLRELTLLRKCQQAHDNYFLRPFSMCERFQQLVTEWNEENAENDEEKLVWSLKD